MKKNCWEVKQCGREPGGAQEKELGVCPAASDSRLDGTNHGLNAGRICWLMSATLCGAEVQGNFISKLGNCTKCEFFKKVFKEEGANFNYGMRLLRKLKNRQ